jgi:hypothetical protein
MKLRELPTGSPKSKRRDELLVIMRDPTRSDAERDAAARTALPLCHEKPPAVMRAGA